MVTRRCAIFFIHHALAFKGRSHKERSGFEGPWTENPLVFDNSFYKVLLEPKEGLLMLPTEKVLLEDLAFHLYVEKYVDFYFSLCIASTRGFIRMSATIETKNPRIGWESLVIRPPSLPTYDINVVIKLALVEDAGDQGDVTSMATVMGDMEVEAHFLAKEDGSLRR
ncbi:hypothetical protein Scep_025735 [Stephania cephalantha]|uniref:Uncharacterized protein n=1 Tax=Stephania cephalantha TaxID=152367 RepID=A0AAP0EIS9_9MAGN